MSNILGSNSHAVQFIDIWKSGLSDDATLLKLQSLLAECPLSGRVIHGLPRDEGFGTMLSSDGWKRVSWVFGPDALPMFLGKSPREVCLLLGFGEKWLDAKIELGKIFSMVIFPSSSLDVVSADWNGVTHVLKKNYSSIWPKLDVHMERFRSSRFEDIESEAGYSMLEVNLTGRDPITGLSKDPRYMSLQCISALDAPTCVHARQFLWDELGLKELFRGDGQTIDDKGKIGPSEYFAINSPIKDIIGAAVTELAVHL